MLGRRYSQSPEITLERKQARDKAKLVGRCGGCAYLVGGSIPSCEQDKPFFTDRFNFKRPRTCFKYTR